MAKVDELVIDAEVEEKDLASLLTTHIVEGRKLRARDQVTSNTLQRGRTTSSATHGTSRRLGANRCNPLPQKRAHSASPALMFAFWGYTGSNRPIVKTAILTQPGPWA
jgi:hypothetical protein